MTDATTVNTEVAASPPSEGGMAMVNRCRVCRKKSPLLVDCLCGDFFCVAHRHHDCAVLRQKELETLKKNMPVVMPKKLEKI